ncbi:unannotated protein [freshwater metagenome]|uniref:Unannotated protein n=1 Tax=freshwater metagenome TaxID=449393 RepID=A0A6J7KBF0_9ZZZZ
MARVSWASCEIDPYDMAPVENLRTISVTGSTSSRGTAGRSPSRSWKSPRRVIWRTDCEFTRSVY